MFEVYRKLYRILDERARKQAVLVFLFLIFVALVEMAGVASILPLIAVLSNPELIETNPLMSAAYNWLGFDSLRLFYIFLASAVLVVLLGSLIVKAFGFWLQIKFTNSRNHALGFRLLRAYLYQPYEWFLNNHTSGMSASVLSEASQVVNGSLFPAMQVIAHGLVAIALVSLLVIADPWLALICVVVLGAAYGLIYLGVRKHLVAIGGRRRTASRARFAVVQEVLGGVKDVLIGNLERTSLERFRLESRTLARYMTRSKLLGEMPSFAMQGLVYGGMIAIMLYLLMARGGLQESLPVLTLYAFAGYRLMPTLQQLYKQLAELRFSRPTLDSIYDELRELEASMVVVPESDQTTLPSIRKQLELRQIGFQYLRAAQPALVDVNLVIEAHSTVGVVGSTGSGKTTMIDLILGLLRPSSGELIVDGVVVTAGNVRSWQKMVGYVPQQIFLIDDSVAANIAFGVPKNQIDHAAVERAARVANLHDFIVTELPEGYETRVGERGVRMSGGQRQRIGIARALYRDPDVLILDEATSALDNLTERAVMDAVNNLGGKKTIVMIAHRLSTVRNCDQIVLMDKGKVAAAGTYDELIEGSDRFRQMAGVAS